MDYFKVEQQMEKIVCPDCGIIFYVPEVLLVQIQTYSEHFITCPNNHDILWWGDKFQCNPEPKEEKPKEPEKQTIWNKKVFKLWERDVTVSDILHIGKTITLTIIVFILLWRLLTYGDGTTRIPQKHSDLSGGSNRAGKAICTFTGTQGPDGRSFHDEGH